MLYPKNKASVLDTELFKNPTAEYRGTPFWAWNTNLKREELLWQIERLGEMGFGGYHMHVRSGMNTEYLSADFMDLIAACVEKGKAENMLSWLYDEDRWPSGAAGGIVTKDPKFRQRSISFNYTEDESATDPVRAYNEGGCYLIAEFDVVLNDIGELVSYKRISRDTETEGRRVYVYCRCSKCSGWYNGQTYVDTLSADAMKKFIDVTYTAYKDKVGDDFGEAIPAIFTDEPQFARVSYPAFANDGGATLPWTYELDAAFTDMKGYSIIDKLPELAWNLEGGKPSKVKYDYFDTVSELFANSFADQCGEWCDNNGIALTGHLMNEAELYSQVVSTGESMRSYRGFGIPGIDMLCDRIELSTAKQTQSAKHQYGKPAMLSELYGVTGWGFDFKGHKFQGDWQAALGVTVRVPHLSWVSMKGSAKRDYPASIHYQSSWYKKYPYVEDHFARLNTALTRGKADVKIGVIHPVETQWLNIGPANTGSDKCHALEGAFQSLTSYLLGAHLDFDFICESQLPSLYKRTEGAELAIGEMSYNAVVVPPITTIRSSTVAALCDFISRGGLVLFVGSCPEAVDGEISDGARELYGMAEKCAFTKLDIVAALEGVRDITIKNKSGNTAGNFLYAMRRDGNVKWLFITRFVKPGATRFYDPAVNEAEILSIKIKGCYKPMVYDTVSGEISEISYKAEDGYTTLKKSLYASDSLLLCLNEADEGELILPAEDKKSPVATLDYKCKVPYELGEPNVLVLDLCRYSWDGESYGELEEMLRIDKAIRREFKWPAASGGDCQPWAIEKEKEFKYVYLKFEFDSEIDAPCKLAAEEVCEVVFNGQSVTLEADGYFTDKEIYTYKMPNIRAGRNTVVVRAPISKRISLENMFLLGSFGVKAEGVTCTVVPLPEKLAFSSVTSQGLPFYGSTVTYKLPVSCKADSDIKVSAPIFAGAVIGVSIDGRDAGVIAYAPHSLTVPNVAPGEHTVELTVYLTRVNTFGALHDAVDRSWKGPNMYFTGGAEWSYEYNLKKSGLLKSPTLEIFEH